MDVDEYWVVGMKGDLWFELVYTYYGEFIYYFTFGDEFKI